MGWWRVKVSSGCPLAGRLAAVERTKPKPAQAGLRPGRAPAGAVGIGAAGRAGHPRRHRLAGDRRVRRQPDRDRHRRRPRRPGRPRGGDPRALRRLPLPHHPAGGSGLRPHHRPRLLRRRPDPGGGAGDRRGRSSPSSSSWPAAHSSAPPVASATGSAECAAEPRSAVESRLSSLDGAASRSPRRGPESSLASIRRCREVSVPSCLFSFRERGMRNLRARVRPQRRWLVSSSAMVMLSVSQGQSRTTSAASMSPRAIARFSSARARRTMLALSRALMCCGASTEAAMVDAWCR